MSSTLEPKERFWGIERPHFLTCRSAAEIFHSTSINNPRPCQQHPWLDLLEQRQPEYHGGCTQPSLCGRFQHCWSQWDWAMGGARWNLQRSSGEGCIVWFEWIELEETGIKFNTLEEICMRAKNVGKKYIHTMQEFPAGHFLKQFQHTSMSKNNKVNFHAFNELKHKSCIETKQN